MNNDKTMIINDDVLKWAENYKGDKLHVLRCEARVGLLE